MDLKRVRVTIKNRPGSPLVIHQFCEKAKQEIRDKQQKRAKKAKEARNPQKEFEAAKYINADGLECLPVTALKKAIITGAKAHDGIKMTDVRQALFVDAGEGAMLVPIMDKNGKPMKGVMREDAVTIGINTRGLTYRPEYAEWKATVEIEFNSRMLSVDQVRSLIEAAGFGVGLCEGRPEKTSALGWGRFLIDTFEEIE